jgi:hypothetical protein
MPPATFTEKYVENLRRELTRALAQLKRAELERDRALADAAELRLRLEACERRSSGGDALSR